MNMNEDEYKGRLVINEGDTKGIRIAETYWQPRNWAPIASSSPTLVNLLSTPSKTMATTLQARQCDIKPTVPTEPLLMSSSHSLQLGRMSPVSPQCYGCMALTCICSTKDQGEYQELENDNKPDHLRLSLFGKVFKHKIEDDADSRSWCINSKKRRERRRTGKRDRPEDVIPYDEDEEKCYGRWLKKLHRENPGRIKESRTNRNLCSTAEQPLPPTSKPLLPSSRRVTLSKRVTSLTTHCYGRNMIVDLDKTVPLDDIKSNCRCDTAPAPLRISTPYQINNRSRIKESLAGLTTLTRLKKYWPAQDQGHREQAQSQSHQDRTNPCTPTQVENRLPSSVPLPGFGSLRKPWRN